MNPEFLALSVVILLFSVIVHEVMHGLVALKFGDDTAEKAGRLTLNPLPHIDPIGTVLLPAIFLILPAITGVSSNFFLAWAKPVPVNPLNFSNIRTGELLVALAGIGANFGLAIIAAILYHLTQNMGIINDLMVYTVRINLMLGVFNLLPIPPLDGSKALISQLPLNLAREYDKFSQYSFYLLIALLYFGVIGFILNLVLIPLHLILGVPYF